ncbi:hypothetical protein [Kutzneria sp. 744]|uniref:hypothetical protein n=1 Tax=Kutzneria sp. (strain 744) TaxID=345341 RepID=UPI000693C0BE|nr:hypothetical protein [Kutzneria sp. 744]
MARFYHRALRVARQEKLNVVLSESAGRLSPGQSWVDGVLARRPCGVVLVLSDLDAAQRAQLASRDIPFVVLDPAGDPAEGVPAVGTNNWRGGVAATRHLIDLGHRPHRPDRRPVPHAVQPPLVSTG